MTQNFTHPVYRNQKRKKPTDIYVYVVGFLVSLLPTYIAHAQHHLQRSGVKILHTGIFHGNEVSAKTGEKWLGLYKINDEYVLHPVILNIEAKHDAIIDNNENEKTGKKVSAAIDKNVKNPPEDKESPLLLIQGAGIKAGTIDTAFPFKQGSSEQQNISSRTMGDFSPLRSIIMKYNNKIYTLALSLGWPNKDYPDIEKCSLNLIAVDREVSQTIATKRDLNDQEPIVNSIEFLGCTVDDGFPQLDWAGDIDQDGKIDLIIAPGYHWNVSATTLFLSSFAKNGELVGLAARFTAEGC